MTGGETPLSRARHAAMAELRATPQAVSWRRQALWLVQAQVGLALAGMAVALVAGLARPSELFFHAVTVGPLLVVAVLGAIAALAPRVGRVGSSWRIGALGAAAAAMVAVTLARGAGSPSDSPEWVCSVSHLGVGLVPLAFALAGLRQSAPSWGRALAAGLGAGTTGALLGELVCHRGMQHVLVYHLGAWLLLAVSCAVISRRLRRRSFAP